MASSLTAGVQEKTSQGARLMKFIPGARLRFDGGDKPNPPRIQLPVGPKPATCKVGELWVDSVGNKLNICTATDIWTIVGNQT